MSSAAIPRVRTVDKAKMFLGFFVATMVATIIGAALIEVARRRGIIAMSPSDKLANLLSPASAAGTQVTP